MARKILLVAAALLLASPGVAAAQETSGNPSTTLVVSDARPAPGQSITISGGGASAFAEITVTLIPGGASLGTTTADNDGNFSLSVTIPASLSPGNYTLSAFGDGMDAPLTVEIVVEASGSGTGDGVGTLPRTGSDGTFPLTTTGFILVLVGAGVVLSVRSRRRAAPERTSIDA